MQLYAYTQVLNCFVLGLTFYLQFFLGRQYLYIVLQFHGTYKHTYYDHDIIIIIRYTQCAVTGYYLRSKIIYFRLLNIERCRRLHRGRVSFFYISRTIHTLDSYQIV